MQKEIFKDVIGYEGIYQVSNMGNVKSLSREVIKGKGKYISKENILKAGKNSRGYYQVVLYKEKKRKTMAVHVLVAMAFLGHTPDGTQRIVPDHKDRDKSNNRVDNLELITQRENVERYYLTQKTSSKYTGVTWSKILNKWQSRININGKRKHLGYFDTELEAHLAYKKALNELLIK
jgi:hypothetical protein